MWLNFDKTCPLEALDLTTLLSLVIYGHGLLYKSSHLSLIIVFINEQTKDREDWRGFGQDLRFYIEEVKVIDILKCSSRTHLSKEPPFSYLL